MVTRRKREAGIVIQAERKMQALTHRASGAVAVINSARFMSFVGIIIGVDGNMDGGGFLIIEKAAEVAIRCWRRQ